MKNKPIKLNKKYKKRFSEYNFIIFSSKFVLWITSLLGNNTNINTSHITLEISNMHIYASTHTHTLKFKYATESGLFPCFELINAP